jgi:hypothetical protein
MTEAGEQLYLAVGPHLADIEAELALLNQQR